MQVTCFLVESVLMQIWFLVLLVFPPDRTSNIDIVTPFSLSNSYISPFALLHRIYTDIKCPPLSQLLTLLENTTSLLTKM
ncbi:hypothetical protein AAHA92_17400 [Salvia divinorum]|uniref:Secreted protein n=1 Tax=Salvia divinorum TaxID=28513 RepID=A0ABD1H1I9_SALDI